MEDASGKPREVHLIDTPGFDDDFDSDTDVLKKIADLINSLYDRKEHMCGVLYLHDISLHRMRGSGLRNLEMLPEFIGKEKLRFLTLVTTHWGTLRDPSREVKHEESLKKDSKYWKSLLEGHSPATPRRFDNTADSALDIIRDHLQHTFVTSLTHEMVVQSFSLGDTSAGKIVRKNLDQAYREALKRAAHDAGMITALEKRYEIVQGRLRERFDEKRALEYQLKAERMKSKQRVFRAVRWVARASAVAGVTTAVLLTAGMAAPAVAALPLVETWMQVWSAHDREEREKLKADHDAADGREFGVYKAAEGLNNEDMEDFDSIFEEKHGKGQGALEL